MPPSPGVCMRAGLLRLYHEDGRRLPWRRAVGVLHRIASKKLRGSQPTSRFDRPEKKTLPHVNTRSVMGIVPPMALLAIGLYLLGSLGGTTAYLSHDSASASYAPVFLKISNSIAPTLRAVDRCYPLDTKYPIFMGTNMSSPSPCQALKSQDMAFCRNFANPGQANFQRLTDLLPSLNTALKIELLFDAELDSTMAGATASFNFIKDACEGPSGSPNGKCKLHRYQLPCKAGEVLKQEYEVSTTEYQVTCNNMSAPMARNNGQYDSAMSCFNTESMYRVSNWHWGRESSHASSLSSLPNTSPATRQSDEIVCDSLNMISSVSGAHDTKVATRAQDSNGVITLERFDTGTAPEYPACLVDPMTQAATASVDAPGDANFVGSWICDNTLEGSLGFGANLDPKYCRVTEYNASIGIGHTPDYEAEAEDFTDRIDQLSSHRVHCADTQGGVHAAHIPTLATPSQVKTAANCPEGKNTAAYARVQWRNSGRNRFSHYPMRHPNAQCGYTPIGGAYDFAADSSIGEFFVPYQYATWRESSTRVVKPDDPHPHDQGAIDELQDKVRQILSSGRSGADGSTPSEYTYEDGNLRIVAITRKAVLGSLVEFLGAAWATEISQAERACHGDPALCKSTYVNFEDAPGAGVTPYAGCFSATKFPQNSASPMFKVLRNAIDGAVETLVKVPITISETLLHFVGTEQNRLRASHVTTHIVLGQKINPDQSRVIFSGTRPFNVKVTGSAIQYTKYIKLCDTTEYTDNYGANDVTHVTSASTGKQLQWKPSITGMPLSQQKYVRLGEFFMEIDIKLQNAYAAITGVSRLQAKWVGANAEIYNQGECALDIGYVPAAVSGSSNVASGALINLCNSPSSPENRFPCGPQIYMPGHTSVYPFPLATDQETLENFIDFLMPSTGKNADFQPTCATCDAQPQECQCRLWRQRFRFKLSIFFVGNCDLQSSNAEQNPLANNHTSLEVAGMDQGEFDMMVQVVSVAQEDYETSFTASALKAKFKDAGQVSITPNVVNMHMRENLGPQVNGDIVTLNTGGYSSYAFSTKVKVGAYYANGNQFTYIDYATQQPALQLSHTGLLAGGALTYESSNAQLQTGVHALSLGSTVMHINNVEAVNSANSVEQIEQCSMTPLVHLLCTEDKADAMAMGALHVKAVTAVTAIKDPADVTNEIETLVASTRCLSAARAGDPVWVLYFNNHALNEGLGTEYSAQDVLCGTEPYRHALCQLEGGKYTLRPQVTDLTVGKGRLGEVLTMVEEVRNFTEDEFAPMYNTKYTNQMEFRGNAHRDVSPKYLARAARSAAFSLSRVGLDVDLSAQDGYLGDVLQAYTQESVWSTKSGVKMSMTCMDGVISLLPTVAAFRHLERASAVRFISEFYSEVELTVGSDDSARRSVRELRVSSQGVDDGEQPARRAGDASSASSASGATMRVTFGMTGSEITEGPGGTAHVTCQASQYVAFQVPGISSGVCVDVSDGQNRTVDVYTPSVVSQADVAEVDSTTKENRTLLVVLLVILGVVVAIVSVVGVVQMRMHRMTWHLNAMLSTPGHRTRGAEAPSGDEPKGKDPTLASTLVSGRRNGDMSTPVARGADVPMGQLNGAKKTATPQPAKGRVLI